MWVDRPEDRLKIRILYVPGHDNCFSFLGGPVLISSVLVEDVIIPAMSSSVSLFALSCIMMPVDWRANSRTQIMAGDYTSSKRWPLLSHPNPAYRSSNSSFYPLLMIIGLDL